jgi:hypothetical protein
MKFKLKHQMQYKFDDVWQNYIARIVINAAVNNGDYDERLADNVKFIKAEIVHLISSGWEMDDIKQTFSFDLLTPMWLHMAVYKNKIFKD